MHLDHMRRALAVRRERAAEIPAGRAVAPEDVGVRRREKARGEERRLAGGDTLLAICLPRAPEPPRPVAPAEEAPRDDAELVPQIEHAEHEVVVLRPAGVTVARGAQRLGAHHEGRVRERALDEGLGAHSLGRVDGVEPALVGAEPVRQAGAREEAHVAADGGQAGRRVERAELQAEPLAVHEVVGVHARDDAAPAMLQARVQRRDQAPVGRGHDPEARVTDREALGDGPRAVRRAVVDHDAFPARLALPRDAAQADIERRRGVEGREQDRDLGRAHRASSRKY